MRTLPVVHILFPALLAAVLFSFPGASRAEEVIVPTQYSTIQAAIDFADGILNSGTTTTRSFEIIVEPGTYAGGITLKSNIPVRGRETLRTIVNGGTSGAAMTASGVTGMSVRNITFQNAVTGISLTAGSTVSVENNVFDLGTSGTGVIVQASPSSSVVNNTFIGNSVGVSRDADSILISNNIFSNNTTHIVHASTLATESNITFNFFQPLRNGAEPIGTNYRPDATFTGTDPLFVDAAAAVPDAHLQTASPCINSGNTALTDPYNFPAGTTTSDIGAYGGARADTIPAPVTAVTSTATTAAPYGIFLTWTGSANYLVAGYKVHYGNASGTYTGTDARDGSGLAIPSPVDAGAATTLSLNGLAAAASTPAAPVVNAPQPLNQSLVVSWSAVAGATGYKIHYGIASTAENTLVVGAVTSAAIPGLTNGQVYKIAVSAIAQTTYYLAVTAYDASGTAGTPGVSHESDYSTEIVETIGPENESVLSNEVSGLPELLSALPSLPDTGCFIATAAYGSPDAGPVRILRSFRDRYLLAAGPGRAFVRWYYSVSPGISAYVNGHPALKPLVRAALAPAVALAAVATLQPAALPLLCFFCGGAVLVFLFKRSRRRAKTAGTISRS